LLLERGATRVANGARRHPGHTGRGCGAGRLDGRGLARREADVLDPELRSRDLEHDARHALSDLGRRAVHLRPAVRRDADARGAVVVEALRVRDVLEPDREADAAAYAAASGRVAGAARQPDD